MRVLTIPTRSEDARLRKGNPDRVEADFTERLDSSLVYPDGVGTRGFQLLPQLSFILDGRRAVGRLGDSRVHLLFDNLEVVIGRGGNEARRDFSWVCVPTTSLADGGLS